MSPLKIKVIENKQLSILWDDDTESIIQLMSLRKHCPCATCMAEKETRSSSYIPLYTSEQITVKNIETIGYYAIGITWKDGHSTGIYEYNYLKSLSESEE